MQPNANLRKSMPIEARALKREARYRLFTKVLRILKTIVRAKGETPLKPRQAGSL